MMIVIDIPEDVKKAFDEATKDDLYGCYYDANSVVGKAIKNGTPLPKGHGNLVDLKSLAGLYDLDFCDPGAWYEFRKIMDNANILVEADEEGAEE